jgi:hypothetical protein
MNGERKKSTRRIRIGNFKYGFRLRQYDNNILTTLSHCGHRYWSRRPLSTPIRKKSGWIWCSYFKTSVYSFSIAVRTFRATGSPRRIRKTKSTGQIKMYWGLSRHSTVARPNGCGRCSPPGYPYARWFLVYNTSRSFFSDWRSAHAFGLWPG